MRRALSALCAATLCLSPAARAAEPAKTAAPAPLLVLPLLPVAEVAADEDLALAIHAQATALLVQTGRYADVSVKQILRMAEREGMAPKSFADRTVALLAAKRLGTTRAAVMRLKPTQGWTLEIALFDDAKPIAATHAVQVPGSWADAIAQGGLAVARAIAAADGVSLEAKPLVAALSEDAARTLAACQAILVRQPIGIETPSLLGDDLGLAGKSCASAAKIDPALAPAWAGLGLALALKGDDAKAVEALARAKSATGYVPLYWIARYWLVTRYQSSAAGASVLREAIARHPGFLLARAYLAEHLNATGAHEEALAAWKDYLAVVPQSPFAQARVGYTLAKLKKVPEALEATRAAQALEPTSRDLKLELASRHVDAGELDAAIGLLEPLAKAEDAPGEVLLRLGWARFLKGELDAAQPLLEKAAQRASRPSEWRTRGRARLDLAKLHARRGDKEKARAAVLEAMRDGYRPLSLSRVDEDLAELGKKAEAELAKEPVKATAAAGPKVDLKPRFAAPKETSPFALSSSGEIDVGRKRASPPPGFELVRF